MDKESLFQELRQAVREGKSVRHLVQLIYRFYGIENYHSHMVISCLMEAFHLQLREVMEIGAAECVGAGVHSDAEIDRILLPTLRDAVKKLDN